MTGISDENLLSSKGKNCLYTELTDKQLLHNFNTSLSFELFQSFSNHITIIHYMSVRMQPMMLFDN